MFHVTNHETKQMLHEIKLMPMGPKEGPLAKLFAMNTMEILKKARCTEISYVCDMAD